MFDLWLVLALCAVLTYAWRGLGVLASGMVDPRSDAFTYVSCVAYAMIAGLVARMLVIPTGALAETTILERSCGSAIAIAAYFWLTRRNLFVGVAAGAITVWLLRLAAAA